MGTANEIKDLYTELSKSKPMKKIIIIISILFTVFVSVVVIKAAIGQHVKMLWIELNIPNEHNDTVFITQPVKIDTVYKYIPQPKENKKVTFSPPISKNTESNVTSINQSGGQTAKDINNNR
ncbi:hypothetical protein LK994_11545 [Ferruginibacter lapsinanis]|uniref:hypothetical protein n=1 Tax=Ferruginibacter lapsinanis TaxID=563172 RepID=UPI001E411B93|nr:hypothetical protein [Ferruginibacter lapsinanis]UEG49265.1 hypothetical protein LK994_11545 [Ferruginibacter lapsinanis]